MNDTVAFRRDVSKVDWQFKIVGVKTSFGFDQFAMYVAIASIPLHGNFGN
jgi:hypothetical protein